MRVSILGATGFIGSHLSQALLNKEKIQALTLFSRHPIHATSGSHAVQGDFSNPVDLTKAIDGSDLVFHLASETFPASSWKTPEVEIERSLKPTLKLIELCAESSVKKIVFLSSGGTVYGSSPHPKKESDPLYPHSPHGIIKATSEYFFDHAKRFFNIHSDIYRVANPYGPSQNSAKRGLGVVAAWLDSLRSQQPVALYNQGQAVRDFIFIDDAVEMICTSIDRPLETSNTYNVGTGVGTSLIQLRETIEKVTEKVLKIDDRGLRTSDASSSILDPSKILQELSHFKFTSLEAGIRRTWEAN